MILLHRSNYADIRFQSYQAIVNGVTGLLYWGWHGATQSSSDRVSWDTLKTFIKNELGDSLFYPVLTAKTMNINIDVSDIDKIEYLIKNYKNVIYLFSVNRDEKPLNVTFSGFSDITDSIDVLFENRKIYVNKGSFNDNFTAYDAHIYKINNTIWSGIVTLDHDYVIEKGTTLTIEPGTTVKFENNCGILVKGELKADSVVFQSATQDAQPGAWDKISFSGGRGFLKNCEIKQAKEALYFYNCDDIIIENCDIHHNSRGIYCEATGITFQFNKIHDQQHGLKIWYNPGWAEIEPGHIHSAAVIYGNKFYNMTSYAFIEQLQFDPNDPDYLKSFQNLVEGNTFYNVKYAITAFTTMSSFKNNVIDNSQIDGSKGIWINTIHPDQINYLTIHHNVIKTSDENAINFTDQISFYCPADYYGIKDSLENKYAPGVEEGITGNRITDNAIYQSPVNPPIFNVLQTGAAYRYSDYREGTYDCGAFAGIENTTAPPSIRLSEVTNSVMVRWRHNDYSDHQYYKIYRGSNVGGPYQLLANVSAPTDSFLDVTANDHGIYHYVVTGINSNQIESDYSKEMLVHVTFGDNFNDNSIDETFWQVIEKAGTYIQEQNERLEMGSFVIGDAIIKSKFNIHGDFDLQIDFNLSPNEVNGNGLSISVFNESGAYSISRHYNSGWITRDSKTGHMYFSNFAGDYSSNGRLSTTADDTTGKLRLTRSGDIITCYFERDNQWVELRSKQGTTGDVYVSIGLSVYQTLMPLEGWVDNFKITKGELIWPPTTVRRDVIGKIKEFALDQNYPNPFNPETVIRFQIPVATYVELKVYNIIGTEIRTLVSAEYEAGYHSIRWDGKDNCGVQVGSGLYIYILKTKQVTEARKALLLR